MDGDDDRLRELDDRLAKALRLQSILMAVERLQEGAFRSDVVMAASATDHGTATLLRGFQAMHDAAVEVVAAAAAAAAGGAASRSNVGADPNAPLVGDHQHGGAVDDDDDDDDSSTESAYLHASGFSDAVSQLQDPEDRRPIYMLEVYDLKEHEDDEYEIEYEDDGTLSFRRFVDVLGLGPRGGGRAIRELEIVSGWSDFPDEDMGRLFQHVLPGHPTLQEVRLSIGYLPPTYLRMLTESIPTEPGAWPLSKLRLEADEEDRELYPEYVDDYVQAIVDMLNRNAAIPKLDLDLRLESHECRLICQALPRNTNVCYLLLSLREVVADSLDGVAASPSLRELCVRGPFSDATLRSLSRQLRTNTTLEILRVNRSSEGVNVDPQVLVDLVRTYNYTLRYVDTNLISGPRRGQVCQQLREYMDRNERIRKVLQNLKERPSRTVSPDALPRLLHLVADLPTLLQRFVKQYYVNVVTERLARGGDPKGCRRGRRRPRLELND